jgi:outer membrane protein OmpA-like peptidoglycan-associated protein
MLKRFIVLFVVLFNTGLFSQAYQTKWGVGAGGIYPRFFSVTGTGFSGNENYGAYLSAERYFNEQVSLRGLFNFVHMSSNYYLADGGPVQTHTVNQFAINLDVLYKFLPCELVSPYFVFGMGATNFTNDNSFNPDVDDTFYGYQVNLGTGIEWGFNENLALKTEAVYRTASNNKIDGNERLNENSKGLFGGNADTYATIDVGLVWYFSKGEVSDLCDKCPEGYREVLVRDTVMIEKLIEKKLVDTVFVKSKDPYLFGVNFAFDKYELNPESYAVLEHAVKTLKENPGINIIISGHTDNKGSNEYNQILSENRVKTVYDYLISNGISYERISKNWYGEDKPLKENDTDINRAFNRRVEIKIKN